MISTKKDFGKDGPPAPFNKGFDGKNVMFKHNKNFYYQCTTPTFRSENTSYCLRWLNSVQPFDTSKNDSYQEKCRCLETSMGPNYCTYWFCTQPEAAEVTGGSATSNQYEDTEFQRIINKRVDYTDCVCRYESMNSKYCQQWWCLKTKKEQVDGIYQKTIEIEEYNCDLASNGSDFCFKWSGRIASPKVKVWSTCECNSQLMRQYHCDNWTCYEKVNKRTYLARFIVSMAITCFIFAPWLLVCCEARIEPGIIVTCTIIVVAGCFFGVICILLAGLLGLFIAVAWMLILLLLCLRNKTYYNYWNNTANQQGSNCGSQSISNNQNQENNGVPAPTQEIQMYSSTSGPISARPAPTQV